MKSTKKKSLILIKINEFRQKVFRVRDLSSGGQFVRIGEEQFPDVNSIMKKFGMERDDVIYQLCNNSSPDFFPPYSLCKPMQIYMPLGRLIDAWKKARKLEQTLSFLPPSHIQEKAKDLVEEVEKLF